ncbi:hypothetical protein B0H17DRAFT_1202026 [Mycena rosella]|uniref:Uncharacterized protein n=1 Tax=Mycena rosella TaxID=1033263 RepID=A0AAD7GHV2_MYCRO|nr:hypothetical protein B0H17DRAFT_1202026 [Mycena rosella]
MFCSRDAPRDITSRWVSNLVDTHEEEVLARNPGCACLYCGKPAIKLQTTLAITLHGDPPTIQVLCQPLCTKNRDDACAIQAQETIDQGIGNYPGRGTEVYRGS